MRLPCSLLRNPTLLQSSSSLVCTDYCACLTAYSRIASKWAHRALQNIVFALMQATPCTLDLVTLNCGSLPHFKVQLLGTAHRPGARRRAATLPTQRSICPVIHRQRCVAGVLEGSAGPSESRHPRCHRPVSRAFSVRPASPRPPSSFFCVSESTDRLVAICSLPLFGFCICC